MHMSSPVKVWRNQKYIRELVGKRGKILSWTLVRVPPSGFSSLAPYPVVLVELEHGKKITAQLVDYTSEHLLTGTRVITVVRRVMEPHIDGVIPYGIKVRPVSVARRE